MKRHITVILMVALLIAVVLFFFVILKANPGPELTVATWTGSYGHAQASAQMEPFARKSGADVRIAFYDGGIGDVAEQVADKAYRWDVIDMELPDAEKACRAGLLERIDPAILPYSPGGVRASRDFLPGAVGRCWVASAVYSRVIAFDPRRFSDLQPKTLADFFDTKKFPGPRALSKASPKYNLEMALLADGVPPKAVYATLSTPAGIERALKKLDGIRGDILWLDAGQSAAKAISERRAAFAAMMNGEVFDAMTGDIDLGIIWDRQLYEFDVFVIPRGDPRRALALDFIRYATGTETLGTLASWLPYGPTRISSRPFVHANPDLNIIMTPFQPTANGRFATAFAVDDAWWHENGSGVETIWKNWLAAQ